jgi:hypothetical protein
MARRFAGFLGMLAFAILIVRGIMTQATLPDTVWTATISILPFAIVGLLLGRIAQTTVNESVQATITAEVKKQETLHTEVEEEEDLIST